MLLAMICQYLVHRHSQGTTEQLVYERAKASRETPLIVENETIISSVDDPIVEERVHSTSKGNFKYKYSVANSPQSY